MTGKPDRVKGHCPSCGPDRWADVRAHVKKRDEAEDDYGIWLQVDHRILECPACESVYHQTVEVFSEDIRQIGDDEYDLNEKIRHWPEVPSIRRRRPDWLSKLSAKDVRLEELLEEVYRALNAGLSVMAVVGVRTLFDRATELVGIDPAISFSEKLAELVTQGYIGPTERDLLSIATDAGSAAAHRGWKPSDDELTVVLEIVEAFLNREFLQRDRANKLKNAIPQKPARKKKSTP